MKRRVLRWLSPTRLVRKIFTILPDKTRFSIYRDMVKVDSQPPEGLVFKLAQTKEELEGAFHILYEEYVRSGFMKPNEIGLRITNYHALPSTSTLIAKIGDEVIATVSIIKDSAFGLPLDAIFDISSLRKERVRLAEISALAIKKSYRQNSGRILFPFLKYLYEYSIKYFGVDYMLIAVNPKHIDFYTSILFFQKLEERKIDNYDFVNGAPAVGAFLNMREAYLNFAIYYKHKHEKKNLFHYFVEKEVPGMQFPDRKYYKMTDPFMTPELLDYFFNKKTAILENMSDRDRSIIWSLYNQKAYRMILPACSGVIDARYVRAESRHEMNCRGRIVLGGERVIKMQVVDVSLNGFLAYLNEPIRFGAQYAINIAVGDFEVVELQARPVWSREGNFYGFQIESFCAKWQQMISHLSQEETSKTKEHEQEEAAMGV